MEAHFGDIITTRVMIEEILGWNISHELCIVIISALPIAELRVGLPVAINLFHMPWYKAFCLATTGNLLPVPILLLFLDPLSRAVCHVKAGQKMVDWVFRHTMKRGASIERYEKIGLALFVAIPLPVTGAWTGCIAAFLLGLKLRYSFLSILVGVIVAGAIVTSLCLLGWLGAAIAGSALSTVVILSWRRT